MHTFKTKRIGPLNPISRMKIFYITVVINLNIVYTNAKILFVRLSKHIKVSIRSQTNKYLCTLERVW